MSILATCKTDFQSLFDIANKYSRKQRYKYNPAKCDILILGVDSHPRTVVMLGAHDLKISPGELYLGNILARNTQGNNKCIKQTIKKCQTVCYAAQSIGSRKVPANHIVATSEKHIVTTKLYYGVCVSKRCYRIDGDCYYALEQFHACNANYCK